MPRLTERERNEALGILRNFTINHVATFLTPHGKPYEFYKEEQIIQELSKIDHELVGLEWQQMQMTVQYKFHTSETDLNPQAKPHGLLENN